jgi:hypothetical protein
MLDDCKTSIATDVSTDPRVILLLVYLSDALVACSVRQKRAGGSMSMRERAAGACVTGEGAPLVEGQPHVSTHLVHVQSASDMESCLV